MLEQQQTLTYPRHVRTLMCIDPLFFPLLVVRRLPPVDMQVMQMQSKGTVTNTGVNG